MPKGSAVQMLELVGGGQTPSQQMDQPTQQSRQLRGGQERPGGQRVQGARYRSRTNSASGWCAKAHEREEAHVHAELS